MPGTTLGVGYKVTNRQESAAFTRLLQTKTDKEQIQPTISGSDNDGGKTQSTESDGGWWVLLWWGGGSGKASLKR